MNMTDNELKNQLITQHDKVIDKLCNDLIEQYQRCLDNNQLYLLKKYDIVDKYNRTLIGNTYDPIFRKLTNIGFSCYFNDSAGKELYFIISIKKLPLYDDNDEWYEITF